ncbi:MAG: glycosyltransferase [Pseudomonadota bacterium]
MPPEIYGGAEQQCLRLSRSLVERGRDVIILTASHSQEHAEDDVIDGVRVIRFPTRHSPDHGGRHILSTVKWTTAVYGWLRRHRRQIGVVHVHQGKLHVLPALLAQAWLGLPFIMKVGSAEEQFDYLRMTRKSGGYGPLVLKQVIKRCSRHVAISSRIVDQMRQIGVPSDRIRRIPNGIDIEQFPFDSSRHAGEDKTFVFMGRLVDEKQPLMMLRCFADILQAGGRHQLIVIGDGPLLETMASFVRDSGLVEGVQLVGRLDDVRPVLSKAHFFLLPSKNEGMSNALLEAMSLGLVPIASAVSGSTDIVRHDDNGYLFDRDDEATFTACLRTAASMSDAHWRTMREAARLTIVGEHVMADIAGTYVDLYQSLGHER